MSTIKQNMERSYAESSLMAENTFINAECNTKPLPVFEEIKNELPLPIWEEHDSHIRCYWKAWKIAFSNLRLPNKNAGFVSSFIDPAFNGHTFMWDSVFMLMFGKYADRIFKFQKTLDNFYSHQHKDGYICRQIDESSGYDAYIRHDPSSTGPEVMPWCEWDYYLNFGDEERLKRVFPCLVAYHRWMKEHFTWRDGTYFSSGYGCGMDNVPRLQEGYHCYFSHGHMVWVDSCMQELYACNTLIKMAETIGREEFIPELREESEHLFKVINETLWDEKTSFYYDLWKNGEFNGVKHIGAYWALIAKCVPEDKAEAFIAHLENENEFKTDHRVPTLSKDDKNFEEGGKYWCGSVWSPTNYMVLKGLDEYKKFSLSHEIAINHLNAVVGAFEDSDTLFENYAPLFVDGRPKRGSWSREDFVGWTGISPISILFEFVFGIKPNVPENKIVWNINLLEKHGIEKYPFGKNGELILMCDKRKSVSEKPVVIAESTVPLSLEIIWNNGSKHEIINL
ncbi:MAG: glycoside hydrolase [Ruminococcaceae bacterium]|nr:glycoside hydrolase [Oscillospiraceae bacterium]